MRREGGGRLEEEWAHVQRVRVTKFDGDAAMTQSFATCAATGHRAERRKEHADVSMLPDKL